VPTEILNASFYRQSASTHDPILDHISEFSVFVLIAKVTAILEYVHLAIRQLTVQQLGVFYPQERILVCPEHLYRNIEAGDIIGEVFAPFRVLFEVVRDLPDPPGIGRNKILDLGLFGTVMQISKLKCASDKGFGPIQPY
jgi:hypothetical protein